MLDPYLRVPLKHDGNGNYEARFRLPDVHGMYTLHLQYFRKGYAYLEPADIVRGGAGRGARSKPALTHLWNPSHSFCGVLRRSRSGRSATPTTSASSRRRTLTTPAPSR